MGFFDYYEKRAWTIEGEPVRDWRALAVRWEENMATECDKLPYEEEKKLWKTWFYRFLFPITASSRH